MLDRKNLRSLVHQPVVIVGRGVLRSPGYSAENEIYADFNADEFDLREVSTREQIVRDVRQLWRPWSAYQFATDHDRAAMLAAIIGASLWLSGRPTSLRNGTPTEARSCRSSSRRGRDAAATSTSSIPSRRRPRTLWAT